MMMLLVPTSLPPTPPSQAHEVRSSKGVGFQRSIKICLRDMEFIKLLFVSGITYAIFWAFLMIIPTIISPDSLLSAGVTSAAMLILGTVSALILGDLMDRTKKFLTILKCLTLSGVIFLIGIRYFVLLTDWKPMIANGLAVFLFVLFSCSAIPLIPIGLELGVEAAFPAQEATVTGLMVIAGNLILLLIYGMVEILDNLVLYTPKALASIDLLIILSVLTNIIVFVFMKPEYRRLKAESQQTTLFNPRF